MADQIIPPLPPGFELEQPPLEITIPGGKPVAQDIPPPPPGFVIQDAQQAAPITAPPVVPPAAGNSIGRGLGMSARSVLQGAGSLLGAIGGDAVNHYVVNPLARALGAKEALPYRDEAAALADKIGLPAPQSSQDRIYNDIGEALTGTGLTLGLGGLLNAGRTAITAPSIRTAAADLLASQPGLQAVSAATGAGAGSIARENGAGPGGQLAAALAGGLAPSAVTAGIPMAVRGALRGGESNRQALEGAIENFATVGATPSVGQGTGSDSRQRLETLLGAFPTSSGVMAKAADRQADQISGGVSDIANGLFRNPSAERAGRAIERGIRGENGFIQLSRERGDQLYRRLDDLIPKDNRVDVANVRQALADLNAEIPGAPSVSKYFQNGRIQGIEGALQDDTTGIAGVLSRPGMEDQASAMRKSLSDQASAVASENSRRQSLGMNNLEPVQSADQIDQQVTEWLQSHVDDRLPYEAVQKLRTLVGRELENNSLVSDVPRSKWKAVYGALSKDMEASATTPEAKRALSRANAYFNARATRIDDIDRVIDRNGGPEKIYSAVMGGVKDGGTTLRAVMQSLPEDGQRAVTAAALRRMGMANPGAQDASGEAFSAATFLSNWSKVSKEARRAMFDRYGPGFSSDLDKVAQAAEAIKTGGQVLANNSGTTRQGAAFTYWGSLAGAVATGNIPIAGKVAAAGIGANVLARAMTSPRVVKWLAKATEMPVSALPAQINVLNRIASANDDPAAKELAEALKQASQNPDSQPDNANKEQDGAPKD